MRLASFDIAGRARFGCFAGPHLIDLAAAARRCAAVLPYPLPAGADVWFGDIISFLRGGPLARRLAETVVAALPEPVPDGRCVFAADRAGLLAPVPRPGKILCVGQNYRDHCREQGVDPPDRPVLFAKLDNTVLPHRGAIRIPPGSTRVDYEAELAFVIGRSACRVPRQAALEHVAGYTILNDVTEREMQRGDGQWVRGKSCDTFAPMGPALVTADEVPDPHRLQIRLTLNGAVMQDSCTDQLVFDIPFLVEFITRSITLEPGDVVSTGTPPGVGMFRTPPVFLKSGDRLAVEIERLGTLENHVVAAP